MLLRDNVYENLRSDILTCRLAPGDDSASRSSPSVMPSAANRYARHCSGSSATSRHRCSRARATGSIRSRIGCARPVAVPLALERPASPRRSRRHAGALRRWMSFALRGRPRDFIAYNRPFTRRWRMRRHRRMAAALCT